MNGEYWVLMVGLVIVYWLGCFSGWFFTRRDNSLDRKRFEKLFTEMVEKYKVMKYANGPKKGSCDEH